MCTSDSVIPPPHIKQTPPLYILDNDDDTDDDGDYNGVLYYNSSYIVDRYKGHRAIAKARGNTLSPLPHSSTLKVYGCCS